jgi:DNA-binding winged helix-turn-helix (wHTH) protein
MVAEREQLMSLRRPPDGWDLGAEEGVRAARATIITAPREWLERQAQPPVAESTAGLPTLRPGVDHLPTSCPRCGSQFLNTEPPLGEHQRGLIACNQCSRQVCWLAAPIGSRAPDAVSTAMPAPERPREAPRPSRFVVRRLPFERLDGCGPCCGDADGHDAITHEAYGRTMALAEMRRRPTGVLRTGPLLIDFDTGLIAVEGAEVRLGRTERGILLFLAARPGRLCRYVDIVAGVWDYQTAIVWQRSVRRWNSLRTPLSRLRQQLGVATALIETQTGFGLRLRVEPPVDITEGVRRS